jgi:hypothetical protein
MAGAEGWATPCPLGLSPHGPRPAGADLGWRPYPLALLVHRALAPVPPLHRLRRRGPPRVITQHPGLCPRGRHELLGRLSPRGDPRKPPPQWGPWGQRGVGPAAPLRQGGALFHGGRSGRPCGSSRVMRPRGGRSVLCRCRGTHRARGVHKPARCAASRLGVRAAGWAAGGRGRPVRGGGCWAARPCRARAPAPDTAWPTSAPRGTVQR